MVYKNTLVASIAVLAGAFVLGLGIRYVRMSQSVVEIEPASPRHAVVIDRKAALGPDIDPKPGFEDGPELEFDVEDTETIANEEPMMEEPVGETEDVDAKVDPEREYAEPGPEGQQRQFGSNFGSIQQFFADLNLNEEEQARLREGMILRRQQFERMGEQERQAEFERMREMGERWQSMSEQERDGVSRRMRDRYEDWRRSDSIELPELSLD